MIQIKKIIYSSIAYYLRNINIEKGRNYLLGLARPLGRQFGKEYRMQTISTRAGFRMELDLSDWIPQDIYLTGDFETSTSAIAEALIQPGDTVVDIGANIGYFSLLFSKFVGRSGKVLSFEPAPEIVKKLNRNLELNAADNVSVSQLALSDSDGTAKFFPGPNYNTGLSSLRESDQSRAWFNVELSRFDKIAADWSRITLVKIDVEGAELKVLRGMQHFLQSKQPYLLLEVTDSFLRGLGDSAESLLELTSHLGYRCYMIGESNLTLIQNLSKEQPKQWNALFSPTDLPQSILERFELNHLQ